MIDVVVFSCGERPRLKLKLSSWLAGDPIALGFELLDGGPGGTGGLREGDGKGISVDGGVRFKESSVPGRWPRMRAGA